jgi:hypothetical protein
MKINTGASPRNGKTSNRVFARIAAFAIILAVAGVWSFAKEHEDNSGCTGRDFTVKTFKGKVTAVSVGDNAVTVVKRGLNKHRSMTFVVCQGAVERGDTQMKVSDVKVGSTVRAHYSSNDGVHSARRISMNKNGK